MLRRTQGGVGWQCWRWHPPILRFLPLCHQQKVMKTEKSEHFKTKFHPQNQTNTPPAARFGRSKASDQITRDIEHVVDKHRPYVFLFRLGCFLWFLCLVAFAFAFVFSYFFAFLLFRLSASSPFCFLALFLRFSASLLLPFSALLCSLFFPVFCLPLCFFVFRFLATAVKRPEAAPKTS